MNTHVYTVSLSEKQVFLAQIAAMHDFSSVQLMVPNLASVHIVDDAPHAHLSVAITVGREASVIYKGVFEAHNAQHAQREVSVYCNEVASSATIEIACHTSDTASLVVTTMQYHGASHTTSSARIMGVSKKNSKTTVTSTIFIAEKCAGVTARQVHKHLLLDQGARAVSVPALDILSDDVSCSHGSAIAHIDPLHLFYLQARGLDEETARDAIIKAFLAI